MAHPFQCKCNGQMWKMKQTLYCQWKNEEECATTFVILKLSKSTQIANNRKEKKRKPKDYPIFSSFTIEAS